jgi:hypothetical protein
MTRRLLAAVGRSVTVTVLVVGCAAPPTGGVGSAEFVDVPGVGSTRVDVPRPTNPASAACDADPLPPASDATVAQRVADLRAIGLFADQADLAATDLTTYVQDGIAETWGNSGDGSGDGVESGPSTPVSPGVVELPPAMLDLAVAQQDHARVWWQDLEADVAPENEVYVQTLAAWSEISAGAFDPQDIAETWAGPTGPVDVRFRLGDGAHVLHPAYLEDWIDPGILAPIDALIASSGRRFDLYKAFDQTAFVIVLTDPERRALEARGWCFQ